MKKILIVILFYTPINLYAQLEKSSSKIEAVSNKAGVLLKTEYKRSGSYYYGYVDVAKITNLSTNENNKGIRIGSQSTGWSFLDDDEIDALITSMEKIKEIYNSPVPADYTEYTFISKSGFVASIYTDKGKWIFMIATNRHLSSSIVFFEKPENIITFYNLIVTAKMNL